MLEDKTLTELRGIAQTMGVPDVFSKTKPQLSQAVSLKAEGMVKAPEPIVVQQHPYDARLMTQEPNALGDKQDLLDVLGSYIKIGLKVDFPDEETWKLSWNKREDTGTLRQPLRNIVNCANRIMK